MRARPCSRLLGIGLLASTPLLGASLLGACFLAPKLVGVRPVGLREARAETEACALNGPHLSSLTREVFALHALADELARDPRAALRALHALARAEPERATLFALAETSYWLGARTGDPDASLAAAAYAYTFLLGKAGGPPPSPYDRRFRWAADLYNLGLLRAAAPREGTPFELAPGEHVLPIGRLHVSVDRTGLSASHAIIELVPADRLRIEGLKLRLRDSGLGVPLVARLERAHADSTLGALEHAPVTAFLRLHGDALALEDGLAATLEFYSGERIESLEVEGVRVPLETDRSAALAMALDEPRVWRFSLTGLFQSAAAAEDNRLFLAQPYQPGCVPIVFVHGTASSPAYWADLFNSLLREPELRRGAQFWFFRYATGSPVLYSAADLRAALLAAVAELDPEGRDPALRHMVLVGHSQGGLLARLMLVDGELGWFERLAQRPLEDFDFDARDRELLTRCLDFDPLPFVERVVYVATPHAGSFLARRWYSGLIAGLIELPREVVALGRHVVSGLGRGAPFRRAPTSLENMDPDDRVLALLRATPNARDVREHSIIAIGTADPRDPAAVAAADDGVVAYASAHLARAASEDLVPSSHSCQSHPATIRALRRILLEHLREDRADRGDAEGAEARGDGS